MACNKSLVVRTYVRVMALFLRSLRSTRGPVAVQLAVARRCASSSSSAGLNSVNALVIGAGVFGGAVAVWVSCVGGCGRLY